MFRDRDRHARSPAHAVAVDCLAAGIRGADPERATRDALAVDGDRLEITTDESTTIDLAQFDRILVLGGGKAAPGVTRAVDAALGDRISDGLLVVPEDDPAVGDSIGAVAVEGGGHPDPTPEGAAATEELLELAESADERTLVLAVVTGGASALLASPAGDLGVGDLRRSGRALLNAGAGIDEINAVRKHTSEVKGGRLAETAAPATVVTLSVSDVVGDPPGVIGSGPTAPDATSYDDALDVFARYGVDVPAVHEHLEAGAAGDHPETPGPDSPAADVPTHVVAGNRTAIDTAAEAARERDYEPLVLSSRVRGEATGAAPTHVAIAEEAATAGEPVESPAVLLSGGETTVDVHGEGTGGPNTEFALAAAISLGEGDDEGIAVGSVDTDGRDGATDAAGALVDAGTVDDAGAAREALERNDSLGFLRERGAELVTGSTGTNVNDLRALVVPGSAD